MQSAPIIQESAACIFDTRPWHPLSIYSILKMTLHLA
jgi:hypothetical protein